MSIRGYDAWKTRAPEDEPGFWDGKENDEETCPECGTNFKEPQPDELLTLLAEAVKAIEDFIDDDPERAGSSFINTGCNDCTEGNTPAQFNTGLCWRHKAARLLKEKTA